MFLKLYMQYVRPHLEFAAPAWSPWTAADVEALERVQKRAIRMVSGLRGRSYEERLVELGMLSLSQRHTQFDLVQTYKIIRGFDDVPPVTSTSDPLNIVPKLVRNEIRRNFFSNRVVTRWNKVPSDIKRLNSVDSFKSNIKALLINN